MPYATNARFTWDGEVPFIRWASLIQRLLAIILSTFVLFPPAARADEIEFGVAYRCDVNEFEIAGFVEHNGEVTVATKRQGHASRLPYGAHTLRCKVGKNNVLAAVKVYPASNGECMGAGYVALSRFEVGKWTQAFPGGFHQAFNWPCMGRSEVITRLIVKQTGAELSLERCTASDWTWEGGYVNVACKSEMLK